MGLILFVAELGGGFGHVKRLLPLARAAARDGHTPLFLLPNASEAAAFLEPEGITVRAIPSGARAFQGPPRGSVAISFADIIGGSGFADRAALAERVARWDDLIDELRPAAAVCEMSPFFNLAAFGGALPALVVGHGFGLPPPHRPRFSPLWDGQPIYDEPTLLANARDVCRMRGRPAPDALPRLLAGAAHAVTGLAALDPYQSERVQPPVGPPELEARLCTRPPTRDLFAYLFGDAPTTPRILTALAAAGLTGQVFVRRGSEPQRAILTGSRITWLEQPEPIGRALEGARLVVHHGSMLTAEEALASGRPQVVAPLYLENLITAKALAGLGVAGVIRPQIPPDEIAAVLVASARDQRLAHRARAFADAFWSAAPPAPDLPATLLRQIV